MKGEQLELWQRLCAQAAVEQDADKLMELIYQINQLLLEKEERLKASRSRNNVPETPL